MYDSHFKFILRILFNNHCLNNRLSQFINLSFVDENHAISTAFNVIRVGGLRKKVLNKYLDFNFIHTTHDSACLT